jgi:plastocyanin
MERAPRLLVPLALLALAMLGAGCSADEDVAVVEMADNFFEPSTLVVEAGVPVRFENVGHAAHNAIDVDGGWTTAELVDPGESDTVVIDEPGTYTYYCSLHAPADASGGMVGTLVVAEDPETAAVDRGTDEAPVEAVEPTGVVRQVPEDYPTVQSGVDAADPGDLVLVGPGTYREQVNVTTPQLVLRGTDRNAVIIDGELEREMGVMVTADGVAVENMTVRDVTSNGFYWDGVTGFRGSHLTSINNGTYGIYAFNSSDGVFEHSYASGSADGGYYIGQCHDCRTILNEVTAEWNAFGFSGTNSSNSLYLVNSVWRNNGAGIVPNTLDSQRYPPSRGATIAGNLVEGNGNPDAPTVAITWPAHGHGILLAGAVNHRVFANVVRDNTGYGIAATPNLSRNFWQAGGNTIRDNVVTGSGHADLVTLAPSGDGGDCFTGNEAGHAIPANLRTMRPCEGMALPSLGSYRHTLLMLGKVAQFPGARLPADLLDVLPEPGDLPPLPGGAEAPVVPAVDVFDTYDGVDLDGLTLPDVAGAANGERSTMVAGLPLADMGPWQWYFTLAGWVLPALVLLGLAAAALVHLFRRDDLPAARRGVWAAIVALPAVMLIVTWWPVVALLSLVASSAYLIGSAPLPRRRRWGLVGGTLGVVLLLTPGLVVVGLLAAGIL